MTLGFQKVKSAEETGVELTQAEMRIVLDELKAWSRPYRFDGRIRASFNNEYLLDLPEEIVKKIWPDWDEASS